MNEEMVRKVQRMRTLIRIGRERLTRHSPIWALFLARETFRALEETLDDLEAADVRQTDRSATESQRLSRVG